MFWQQNLERLRACAPEAAKVVEGLASEPSVEVRPSRSGWPTALWRDDGQGRYLHSSFDPWSEARRIISAVGLQEQDVAVVLGLGLGYHVLELARQHPQLRGVIVLEKDPWCLRRAMEHLDLSEIMVPGRFVWIVGPEERTLILSLSSIFDPHLLKGVVFIEHSPSLRRDTEFYKRATERIRDATLSAVANVTTALRFNREWLRNRLLNLPAVMTRPGVQVLFGGFGGRPVIIVAAGPSLDKNIHLLAEAKGKAVILAVDTTLRPLLQRGIHPDFVFSVDGQLANYRHFEGIEVEGVCLVADPMTHHKILETFRGPVLIAANSRDPIMRWTERFAGKKGNLDQGGSVATTAFSMAVRIGADPVIFVGQDLSFPEGRYYAKGTYYEPTWRHRGKEIRVPGWDGGEVATSKALLQYLRWFEYAISHFPDTTFINATEGGARITGTRPMTLREAIDRYCQEPVDVPGVLAAIPPVTPDWASLLGELEYLRRRLEDIRASGQEGEKLARELKKRVAAPARHKTQARIDKILKKLDDIDAALRDVEENHGEELWDILCQVIHTQLFDVTRTAAQNVWAMEHAGCAAPESPQEKEAIAERSRRMYEAVRRAAEDVGGLLDEALEPIRRAAGEVCNSAEEAYCPVTA